MVCSKFFYISDAPQIPNGANALKAVQHNHHSNNVINLDNNNIQKPCTTSQ